MKPKADLRRILGKNSLGNGLVKPMREFVKSVTEVNSKVQKLKTYNKVINDFIHENSWHEAINEELGNFNAYQT